MERITYTYNTGTTRSIGSRKGFAPHHETLPTPAVPEKFPKQFSNSAVEIIMPNEFRKNSAIATKNDKKEKLEPAEDVPADEFEDASSIAHPKKSSEEDFFQIEEEEKDIAGSGRKVRDTFVKGVGDPAFKQGKKVKEPEDSKIPKSVTCSLIITDDQLHNKLHEKKPEVALKESKSPDPFENAHPQTESRLMELINSTTSPNSPLRDLKKSGSKSSAELRAYKHFVISLFESASFIRKMVPIKESELVIRKLSIPRPPKVSSNKTLILDLDETLVHCVMDEKSADVKLPIKLPGGTLVFAKINFRPNLVPFLERVSKVFEVVIFTASHKYYADAILDHIDKERKLVHHRLYRQHCVLYQEKVYIKDLRILGRDLKQMIIVDNAPYAFASQIDNGYPIIPFYENKNDTELVALENYLTIIETAMDVREVNRSKFKLRDVTETNICDYAQYYQHTCSDAGATEQSCESLASLGDETPNMYEKVKRTLKNIQTQIGILYDSGPNRNLMH